MSSSLEDLELTVGPRRQVECPASYSGSASDWWPQHLRRQQCNLPVQEHGRVKGWSKQHTMAAGDTMLDMAFCN